MSRLYDRVLDDCGPFRFSDLESPRALERFLGGVARDHLADELHLDQEMAWFLLILSYSKRDRAEPAQQLSAYDVHLYLDG